MSIDLARARQDTPACERLLHFNNAGAALMPQVVADAVVSHIRLEEEMGGYEAARQAHDAVDYTYEAAARLLGCGRDEIAIMDSATRAWQMAFYSIPFRRGDRILTSMSEYASNYIAFLQISHKLGVKVEPIPNDEQGQTSVAALGQMLDKRVRLIAINHVPTDSGLVNPAAAIGKLAREADVLYLLDACQSVGQMPLDVNAIGCDFLSGTGRKYLRGPRGTGFLYVRREHIAELEPPMLDLLSADWTAPDQYEVRPDALRFETWEANIAAKIGLAMAIDYALQWGLADIRDRVYTLAADLRARLGQMRGVTVRDIGAEQCGIVTFTVDGYDPTAIREALGAQHINVWVILAEHALLDMPARGLDKVVRASVHYYNSEDEVAQFCAALAKIIV